MIEIASFQHMVDYTLPLMTQRVTYFLQPSVELTLIHCTTHNNPLIDEDKKLLFGKIEDA